MLSGRRSDMNVRRRLIREFIRNVIREELTAADLQKGFYPYEIEHGIDIHSFWYKSPGRPAGSDGDPGRPSDAFEFLGFKQKSSEESSGGGGEEVPSSSESEHVE